MKHLITGGAGFIGSHLANILLKKEEKVYCLDNFYTGDLKNIEQFKNNANFELINQNVEKPIKLIVDKIWHLACPGSPDFHQNYPLETSTSNAIGTFNMLNLAKEIKAEFLLTSTSEIYGNSTVHPQNENYNGSVNCNGIRSCYSEGKRFAESLTFNFSRIYKIKVHVARIFNTYGPGMKINDGRVISNFICQALQNKPINIYGGGDNTRSFCYIEDLVNGLTKLMNSNYFGAINLGNNEEISILDLAGLISKKINKKVRINHENPRKEDIKFRKPDLSLAKKELNWEPKVNLENGIQHTINYFQKILN